MAENKHRYPANWKQIRAEQKHTEKIIVKNCEKLLTTPTHRCIMSMLIQQRGKRNEERRNRSKSWRRNSHF